MSSSAHHHNHHEQSLLRLAAITASLIHILIALLFIIAPKTALFTPIDSALEPPVLIGDPDAGGDDGDEDSTSNSSRENSEPIAEDFLAEEPLVSESIPTPQLTSPVQSEETASPIQATAPTPTPSTRAPYIPLPSKAQRQARWKRALPEKSASINKQTQQASHTNNAFQNSFSTDTGRYEQTAQIAGNGNSTKKAGKVGTWGERARENAAHLELDLYIRRIMHSLKDRALFFEETISVAHSVHTRVSVILIIERSGKLRHIEVRPSTGIPDIDLAIKQFCQSAVIPPLPKQYTTDELVLPISVRIEQAAGIHRMRFIVDAT